MRPLAILVGIGLLVMFAALAAKSGWFSRSSGPKDPNDEWSGTESVDPAGDITRLQGKWERPAHGDGITRTMKAWVVFDGNTVTFHSPFREQPDFHAGYRFVVNSSLSPRVMRFTHWLGPGEPLPGHGAPQARWYRLDVDTLTIWNKWAELGESVRVTYRRAKEAK